MFIQCIIFDPSQFIGASPQKAVTIEQNRYMKRLHFTETGNNANPAKCTGKDEQIKNTNKNTKTRGKCSGFGRDEKHEQKNGKKPEMFAFWAMLPGTTRTRKQAKNRPKMIPKVANQNRQMMKHSKINGYSRLDKERQKGKTGKRKRTETAESVDFIGIGNKITCFVACLRLNPDCTSFKPTA